jgi:2-dehydropantoate 2-reductase
MKKKRVVVVGCGGVGGVVAARLTRAGVDVTPVTGNEEIARALAQNGFHITEFDRSRWNVAPSRPPVVALAGGEPGAPFDVAIMCTKATTLVDATRAVLPHLTPDAPIITCQNGLPEELAAGQAGIERVLGCVVVFGATMTAPGEYQLTSKGALQLGRPSPQSPQTAPAAGLLEAVAPVTVVHNLLGARWSKLALNCATSTIGAIGGDRLGPLLRRRFVRRLVLELWTEVAAVALASKVRLEPIGGTLDIRKMALTSTEQRLVLGSPKLAWKHAILVAVGTKYRRMRSSMLIALERGRVPEIDYLNGEVCRRGHDLGLPTPVNDRLVTAVKSIQEGRERSSIDLLKRVFQDTVGARLAAVVAGQLA